MYIDVPQQTQSRHVVSRLVIAKTQCTCSLGLPETRVASLNDLQKTCLGPRGFLFLHKKRKNRRGRVNPCNKISGKLTSLCMILSFVNSSATHRTFGTNQWQELRDRLGEWRQSLQSVNSSLQSVVPTIDV